MPGGTFCVMNATCSVSAKKLSGMRSSTSRPTGIGARISSGMSLVGSRTSKSKLSAKSWSNSCTPQLPFREVAGLDRVPQVAAVEIRIGAVDLDRLVPDHRLQAELRLPVELDEGRFVLGVDQPEGVDAEAFHEAEGARDGAVRHDPHDHVHAFGRQRDEVPEIVVRRLRLREGAVGLRLHRMDQVGKLDRVLDEEDRDVVADEVPVAFLGVELDGEAAHVARQVERALAAGDGREAHEGRRLLAGALEDVGAGVFGKRIRRSRNSRARRSRAHARRARECARGRSGRSSRGNGSPRSASGRARRSSACSGRRRPGRPGRWSAFRCRPTRSGAVRRHCRGRASGRGWSPGRRETGGSCWASLP